MSDATDVRPRNETERLEAIRRYDILDTPPDGAFDRITQLAARICRVPISTITIVDEDRIWFKSAHGIEVDQIDRDPGLCASAVMQLDPYVIPDASIDPRTLDNPLVCGELGLRFYAAIPLTTASGHNLGTLNVIDVEPRELEPEQLESLRDLAAIVMDELELRLAAKATVALEAAREAERFRDAIVAGVSHEMRTPLAILKGLVSLTDQPGELDPGDAAELQAMQRRQLRHLDWLVHQFLDYVTLEDDRPPAVHPEPADATTIVDDAADVFDDDAVRVEVDGTIPPVLADPDRTRQIVIELVNNGLRFSHGTPVTVRIASGADGTVRIAVTDRGPGIHPDDLDRVFEKAFRGRNSTGTGLGLYVTRTFAEAQGGRIEVASDLGTGSTFTLVVPSLVGAA